jgi:predicted DNA binding CopG/RHH family protein
MPETAQPLPPSAAAGFASLLSGLIASKPAPTSSDPWNDDVLAQDVATLSYEQALRTHARYRPSSAPSLADLDSPISQQASTAQQTASACAELRSTARAVSSLEERRKSASITIRLSHGECDQLRERAAAAGLTVSAYLRSCVFEVESLRAQVKDTLAQLRSASAAPEPNRAPQSAQPAVRSARVRPVHDRAAKFSALGWLLRFLFAWHRSQRMASA